LIIANITAREKIERPIKIGSAYVDRGRCLPWSGNAPCIVCEEVSPTSPKAIYLKKEAGSVPGGEKWRSNYPLSILNNAWAAVFVKTNALSKACRPSEPFVPGNPGP